MRTIILIAHNIRSTHNVGSILRTAEGFAVSSIYLTGYTPYPHLAEDDRLPHLAKKLHNQISKTALGAQNMLKISHHPNPLTIINQLKRRGVSIVALEQTPRSINLPQFKPPEKVAIIVGHEVQGLDPDLIKQADSCIQIPMLGQKESYNVSVAAAIALYHIRFIKI